MNPWVTKGNAKSSKNKILWKISKKMCPWECKMSLFESIKKSIIKKLIILKN